MLRAAAGGRLRFRNSDHDSGSQLVSWLLLESDRLSTCSMLRGEYRSRGDGKSEVSGMGLRELRI